MGSIYDSSLYIPDKYKGKLFLTVADIQDIFQIGETKTYEFLKENPPFKVIKIGVQYRISSISFWKWYNENI